MPYKTRAELPEGVREHLPEHAQEVYRAAYNSAWDEYSDPKKRRSNESQEEATHKIA
jgi:cation transport regulator